MLVKGYRVVELPVHESEQVVHQIYLKEHNDKRFQGRVLFVGNVDVTMDLSQQQVDSYLKALFRRFGDIDEISLSEVSDDEARFAHVVFNKKASLKLALQAPDKDYLEIWSELGKKMGFILFSSTLVRSTAQIRKKFGLKQVDCNELKSQVDAFMSSFEVEEQEQDAAHKEAADEVDEDGFVTVSSKKRKRDDADVNAKTNQQPKKNKKKQDLKNFYRFQIRDQKMKQLDMLRKKFEEDKERVAKMKESRKFKPF